MLSLIMNGWCRMGESARSVRESAASLSWLGVRQENGAACSSRH